MHMKDGSTVAEPVLATQPMESPALSEAAAVALARDEDLENLRFVDGELTGFSGKTLDVRGVCSSAAGLAITISSESASWTASLISANGATRGSRTRRFSGHACGAAA